jgi:hypothetical protein
MEDETRSCFMLMFDPMHRLDLKATDKAIFCHENWGPSFGDDLTVSDKCHISNETETNFPFSYGY